MANGKGAIGILFGVAGGGSISGESGVRIQNELSKIAERVKLKVKINIDKNHFNTQLNQLQKDIQQKLGKLNFNVSNTGSNNSTNSSSGLKQQEVQAKDLYEQLEKVRKAREKVLKSPEGTFAGDKAQANYDAANKKLEEMLNTYGKLSSAEQDVIGKIKRYHDAIKKTKDATESANAIAASKLQDKAASLYTDNGFDKVIQRSEKAKSLVDDFKKKVDDAIRASGGNLSKKQVDELNNDFVTTHAKLKEIQKETDTVGNKFKEAFKTHVVQHFATILLGAALRALKQVYDNVVKLDTAMTQFKIVTKQTGDTYKQFAEQIASSAKKIGSEITSLINSATTFARLGYSVEEAAILAEKATAYSRVANVEIGEATNNLTAIIKAFKISANDLESVLDQMITVGNNYAISSAEIGEAMNNAASALAANGNTLQQAIGIVTAANVTIQNASRSSTAVRTIAARLSASTAELEELGDDAGSVLSTSDLDARMRAYGVAITDVNGNLRSTYEILSDLSQKWDSLSSTQRAAIADMVAGTRQQNAFFSIMQNWSDAEKIVSNAGAAAGAYADALGTYTESIEGKLNSLKASWQEFSQNLLNSDLIKFFIDLVKVIVNVLNAIISLGDGAPAKIAMVIASVVILSKVVEKLQKQLGTDLPTVMAKLKKSIAEGAKSVGKSLLSMVKSPYFYIAILISAFVMFADKMPGVAQIIVGALTLISAAVVTMFAIINTSVHSFMASNPIGWILAAITAVVLAITTLVKGIISLSNSSTQAMEEAVNAAKASKEAWEDSVKDLKEMENELKETENRIAELHKLSNEGKITLVQQEELEKLEKSLTGLEAQKKSLEDIEKIKRQAAEKDAASAINKIIDEKLSDAYVQEDNSFWNGVGRVAASVFSFGISDALGYGISDWTIKTTSKGDYVKDILGNWENATEQQRDAAIEFYNKISEQKDMLTYYTDDNLAQWQEETNAAYDTYYEYMHRFLIANGNYESVWESALGMEKFPNIKNKLKDLANSGKATAEEIQKLYNNDTEFHGFLDYLASLGLYSANDTKKVQGLVNQIQSLKDGMKQLKGVGFLDILEGAQDKFDSLKNVLTDISEAGIASADSISELLDKYPSLLKYLQLDNKQGYKLNSKFDGLSSYQILQSFASESLQPYVDELAKYKKGTENYTTAQENLNNAVAVFATLLRSEAIEEATKAYNNQKDILSEQENKYKDLIDIRKELLETYRDEIKYQNDLAKKQQAVSVLQSRLEIARLDTSAAGRAKAREIQSDLQSAKDELEEFTLDKAIDELTKNLDDQYNEYKSFIEEQISNIERTIEDIAKNLKVTVDIPEKTKEEHPWKSYEDAVNMGYKVMSKSAFNMSRTRDDYSNYQEYLDAMYLHYVGTYHSGGFVGDLKSNETFAKLLNGEFVATPQQMDNFINKTLPTIVQGGNGATIEYNSPLISIQCENVTEDSLPKLKDLVDEAVRRVGQEMESALSRTGYKKKY